MTLMANGVPVYNVASPFGGGFAGPYASMYMWSENDESLLYDLYHPARRRGRRAGTVPFDAVVQAVQARIDEGWLRAVDSLELCYGQTARLANGKRIPDQKADEQNPSGVLVPTWKVNGYDRMHLHRRLEDAYKDPTAFERSIHAQREDDHITFDATNGELWNRKNWEAEKRCMQSPGCRLLKTAAGAWFIVFDQCTWRARNG